MPKISLSGPADLLTILPFHLGFQPTRSVVVVCFHGKRIGLVARFDVAPDDLAEASAAMGLPTLVRDRPSSVCLVGYEDDPGDSDAMSDALRAGLEQERVVVQDRLVVRDGRWLSVDCDCCPPGGRPMPEPADVPGVAGYIALGHSVLDDRDSLARLIRPMDDDDPRHTDLEAAVDTWQARYTVLLAMDRLRSRGLFDADDDADDAVELKELERFIDAGDGLDDRLADLEDGFTDGFTDGFGDSLGEGFRELDEDPDDDESGFFDALEALEALDAMDALVQLTGEGAGGVGLDRGSDADVVSPDGGWAGSDDDGRGTVIDLEVGRRRRAGGWRNAEREGARWEGNGGGASTLMRAQSLRAWSQVLRGELTDDALVNQVPALAGPLRDVDFRDALIAWLCPGTVPLSAFAPSLVTLLEDYVGADVRAAAAAESVPPQPRPRRGRRKRGRRVDRPGRRPDTRLDGRLREHADVWEDWRAWEEASAPHHVQARIERVCRVVPAAHAAPLLAVVGNYAWWRGDGARAGVALDTALELEPDHRLAGLIREALDRGLRGAGSRSPGDEGGATQHPSGSWNNPSSA
jgi:hypothetical protein